MLGLLRRHQKILFIIITAVIVISFSFFGTSETQSINYTDHDVAQTIEGNSINYRDIEMMKAFCKQDVEDQENSENIFGGNFFNDGFLKKDLFESGLATAVMLYYKPALEKSFSEMHKKEKNYTAYSHPYIKSLGAESIWRDFAPDLYRNYSSLINASQPLDAEAIEARIKLYLSEKKFNQDVLKRLIYFDESRKQANGIPRDTYLMRRDLSLFNYKAVEDWFSGNFLNILSQFIYNVADVAEAKGYSIDKEEVEAKIMFLAENNYKQFQSHLKKQNMDVKQYMNLQLTRLGMTQRDLFHVMEKVMLFRAFVYDLGSSVFESPYSISNFSSFAMEKVQVDQYEMSSEFKLSNLSDLVLLESYINSVASKKFKGVVKEYKTIDELKQQAPYLIQKKFVLEVTQVNKALLASRFTLKQTWDWQLGEQKNWKMMQEAFANIELPNLENREEKYAALSKLNDQDRLKLDEYARMQLVDLHPEWLKEAMEVAKSEKTTLSFHGDGANINLPGINEPLSLMQALDKLESVEGKNTLVSYTQNQEMFYSFKLLKKNDFEIVSFSEAKSAGILEDKVSERFIALYEAEKSSLKEKLNLNPIDKAKIFKENFSKSLNELAQKMYASEFQEIEKELEAIGVKKEVPGHFSVSFLTRHRFAPLLNYAREQLKEGNDLPEFLRNNNTVKGQFGVKMSPHSLTRAETEEMSNNLFSLNAKQWSSVVYPLDGSAHFFYVNSRENGELKEVDSVLTKQKFLANELVLFYFYDLLDSLKEKKLINTSI
ncbi:MAG: hypothetical protein L7U87_08400 [Chlamydiales bacterium]|nr:hypothetical protein [Chlamydiales bacterium]